MNVLSLFDGISCGQLALQKAGIEYENYYASEIDKYALAVTQTRFPNTLQLGDIREWQKWQLPQVDLIMGGSPCQGFSVSGKGLNFDDPRSKLFFDFVDIVNHYKPKYFLLENVKMKKEWQNIITQYMGIESILIDSALVSAQSRKRLYWTNILDVKQPEDKGILLKDILQSDVSKEFYKSEKAMLFAKRHNIKLEFPRDKAFCITSRYHTGGKQGRRNDVLVNTVTLKSCARGWMTEKEFESNKYPTLHGSDPQEHYTLKTDDKWRKLTPIECERLQTISDNYTLVSHPVYKGKPMSKTQRYKMLGNAWTVDVIAHIMKGIKSE